MRLLAPAAAFQCGGISASTQLPGVVLDNASITTDRHLRIRVQSFVLITSSASASSEILLVSDALVRRDHYIEACLFGDSEQLSVCEFSPTPFVSRLNLMRYKPMPERRWRIVVEQDTHAE